VQTAEEVGMRRRSPGVAGDEAKSDAAKLAARSAGQRAGAARAPRRTCVVCRSTTAKRTLHRIVRSPAGTVAYDPTGKAAGRGAYLCGQPACLDQAVRRRSVQRALKVTDTAATDAAVEALRNRVLSGSADQPASRSSDDEEVRSG
jgi:predicted RNA-binding protein YlxR (DUF448 family)